MSLRVDERLGSYRILAPLGAGAMGEVFRARDDRLGRDVAIKVLPDAFAQHAGRRQRFLNEARAIARLDHPNLLVIHDIGEQRSVVFLVTELLEGGTLRQLLAKRPPSCREALRLAVQMAHGLACAHERGIVHRDLKPENLFVTEDGRLKILDFGLAKTLSDPDSETLAGDAAGATRPGTFLGTVGYVSPEQARGETVDPRSDLFSFGAILYELLSGRRAFDSGNAVDTLSAVLTRDPRRLTENEAPVAVRGIVERCLEKHPAQRFDRARDLAFALEAILGSTPAAAGHESAEHASSSDKSVAVLVFRDLGGDGQNAHLGIGLADAIITELSQIRSLLVRPTAASLRFQGAAATPAQIARELGVGAVVDGSFQRAGSRLRVTVQLLDVRDPQDGEGRSLWATKVDASLDQMFTLQDDLAHRVAEALRVDPASSAAARSAHRPGPRGSAYELYVKGQVHMGRETVESTRAAIECFEGALSQERGFALAHAGLATAYARMAFTFEPDSDWHARAHIECDRAFSLEPGLPQAHFVRARLRWSAQSGFDHHAALGDLAAALDSAPGLGEGHTWLGTVLFHVAMFEDSVRHLERAIEIDPHSAEAWVLLGTCRYLEGKYAEARAILTAGVEPSASAWGRYIAALCDVQLGDLDDAEARVADEERTGSRSVYFHSLGGLIAARRGRRDAARRSVEATVANRRLFGHYHHAQYDVACIFAQLDEPERALDWLQQGAHNGFPCYKAFQRDPLIVRLHSHQRFHRLMGQLEEECQGYNERYRDLFEPPADPVAAPGE